MSNNIADFKPKKTVSIEQKPMFRVIDITSPFFCWEGWLHD